MGKEIQVFSEAATTKPNSSFRVGLYQRNNLLLGLKLFGSPVYGNKACYSFTFEGTFRITPIKGVRQTGH